MLSPTYLSGVADEVIDVYSQVEQDIADDIVRRTLKMGYVTDTARWQYRKAQEFGYFQDDVAGILSRAGARSRRQIKLIMSQAATDSLAFDDAIYKHVGLSPLPVAKSPALQALLLQGTDRTMRLISNFTKTTSTMSYEVFGSILDRAYLQILSGAFSPQTAIYNAIRELSQKGITRIAYESAAGNVSYDNIDVAVRRAVITGVNQSVSKLQLARAQELGCELVQVSSHSGARPTHAEWQGGIYCINGTKRGYANLVDVTGYGSGDGLCGWNCYHSFFPFFEGLSTSSFSRDPSADEGRDNDDDYALSQKQRYYERQIRAAKREASTLNTAMEGAKTEAEKAMYYDEFQRASVKLKRREAALQAFLDENGRTRDWYRLQTGSWNRSVSAKAVWANRKAGK